MSTFSIELAWRRTTPDFDYKTFDRGHIWYLAGGQTVQGSAAPEFSGDPEKSNPEEALLAALSSCHMLTFLHKARLAGFVVTSYRDHASGIMEEIAPGKMAVTKVTLSPQIEWNGQAPDAEQLAHLHHKAHEECFIANSVKTEVTVA